MSPTAHFTDLARIVDILSTDSWYYVSPILFNTKYWRPRIPGNNNLNHAFMNAYGYTIQRRYIFSSESSVQNTFVKFKNKTIDNLIGNVWFSKKLFKATIK